MHIFVVERSGEEGEGEVGVEVIYGLRGWGE